MGWPFEIQGAVAMLCMRTATVLVLTSFYSTAFDPYIYVVGLCMTCAAEAAEERMDRDAAIENWRIAVAFWEVHTVRRCFRNWAIHRAVVLESAMAFWRGTNMRETLRHWRTVSHVYVQELVLGLTERAE